MSEMDYEYEESMRAPRPRNYPGKLTAAQQLRLRAEKWMAEADALEAAEAEKRARYAAYGPEPEEGSVVRFNKRYGSGPTRFTHCAIRKNGVWYLTQSGRRPTPLHPKTWIELLDWLDGAELELAGGWMGRGR